MVISAKSCNHPAAKYISTTNVQGGWGWGGGGASEGQCQVLREH